MPRPLQLAVEQLDDRCVPAVFGVPWADAHHLTMSFAPDGTGIANGTSNLFQSFDAQLSRSVWQGDILQAVQTWAAAANISVGVIADGGQPFGITGDVQGDSRFGDIRIGGEPMALSTLALSTPPDPFLSGTLAGDILFNTSINLTDPNYDLYSVALHEVGHALGLAENTDPTSVMSGRLQVLPGQLPPNDVTAIQSLYGTPPTDPNAVAPNTFPLSATPLSAPSSGTGGPVPLIAYGELTTAGTADAFSFQVPPNYSGSMTIRVRTAGISLLEPTVRVYDSTGAIVANGAVSDPTGGEVVLQVPAVTPNATFYIQIDGPSAGLFGTGRYAMAVTFDRASEMSPTRLESVLQGPYDTWAPADVAALLVGDDSAIRSVTTAPVHNTPATAIALAPSAGTGALPTYQVVGTPHGEGITTYYQLVTPNSSGPLVLSVAVSGIDGAYGRPHVQLFDAQNLAVHTSVLVNDGGTYAIQAVGLTANQTYYIRVSSDSEHGGYALTADFNQPQTILDQVAAGQLAPANPTVGHTLFVARPQHFRFVLSTSGQGDDDVPIGSLAAVQMTITDSTGAVSFSLSAGPGRSASATVLLAPGKYSVSFTDPATGVTQLLNFTVRMAGLSDPVGPRIIDPLDIPLYQAPVDPTLFLYPPGILSPYAYLWFPALY